jgi:CRP-like cAMP-binding protein
VRHEPGTVLIQEGSVPTTIHLLLDGTVTCTGHGSGPTAVTAPAALGFAEVLQGTPASETVRTTGIVVTLALTAEEVQTLLADNADLVEGLFATLAESGGPADGILQRTDAASELEQLAAGGLSPIDKILALQRVPLFERVSPDEMRHLAEIASVVQMAAGETLFPESALPALWVILSGEVVLEASNGEPSLTAKGGDVIGSIGTMAGRPLDRAAAVTRNGTALRIDHDDLFDLLGERPELLRQMFARMFRMRETEQPASV